MIGAFHIPDEQGMHQVGRLLAPLLLPWLDNTGARPEWIGPGALIFLQGGLGAGKTTLARGLLRALGVTGAVRSPTYTLVEPYEVSVGSDLKPVFHLDLYRLSDPEELDFLGWQEWFGDGGLMLVEWPEKAAGALPLPDLRVELEAAHPGRWLTITGRGVWGHVADQVRLGLGGIARPEIPGRQSNSG